jgi:hypothetical protein
MTTTATLVQTDTTTTTVTQLTNLVLRDTTPTVPAYLSACSGSPSKLSSACSCYIGTTASDQFTTETSFVSYSVHRFENQQLMLDSGHYWSSLDRNRHVYDSNLRLRNRLHNSEWPPGLVRLGNLKLLQVTETYFSTTTTTSTVYSTPSLTCHGNTEDLSSVFLRIEGATDTIFEGSVISGPRNITTPSGGTHHCDGTNNGNNPKSGATCTTALDEAACRFGFPYDGSWSPAFDDYFITSIDDSTQTSTQFWGLLLNYQFTPVGGCQQQTQPSDNVLWAYDAFNAVNFLQASPNSDFSSMTGVGNVGVQKYLYVRDGSTSTPISGASIAGAITDANGRATVSFTTAGTFSFKATKSGSIRSNAVKIIVGSN